MPSNCFIRFLWTYCKCLYIYKGATCLVYIIFFFACFVASAQNLSFQHLTVEDGLTQNTITDIRQDSLGMLWVGTHNGLNRYNGYEFETFEASNKDSSSIPSNFINCLELGKGNVLWIGTKSGLCQWNQKAGRFFRMNSCFANDRLKGIYEIGDILVDSQDGVWVMAENKGFHIFYKAKDSVWFKKMLSLKDPPGNNIGFYGQIMEDLSGNIWIGTSRSGLWVFDKRDKSIYRNAPSPATHPPITSILQDADGKIWMGTLAGLFVSSDNANSFEFVKALKPIIIRCLYLDPQKRLWVGTDNKGLLLYNRSQKTFVAFDHNVSDPSSLLHNSIRCILQDQQNILWVGTYAGGLNYYNHHLNVFNNFTSGPGNKNLSDNLITGFSEDKTGQIWIATDRGGLNLFNPENSTFRQFRTDQNQPSSLSSDIIQCITHSSNNNLWLGHWSTGLDYLDEEKKHIYHYTHVPGKPGSLSSNTVNYILEDSKKNLWVATDAGLNFADAAQFHRTHPSVISFQIFKKEALDAGSVSDSYIKTICEDRQGKIWVGSWTGLNLWNPETRSFFHFKNNPKRLKIFTQDYILCVAQGNGLNMLVGTNENGLLYYFHQSDSLIYFNKQNGFPSNTIVGIQQDDRGVWWISSTNGLIRFNEKTLTFSQYNRHDGLPSNEFRMNAYGKLQNGQLLFGGNNGFTVFHPDSVKPNLYKPNLFISKFQLFNRAIKPTEGSILTSDISLTRTITLPHDQSSIGFEFTAINFTAPEKNSYAYQLKGMDRNWNYVGSQRTAYYSYVPPGEYVFKVKAANNDGLWAPPIELKLIINPPWWGTVWFKMLALFITLTGLVLLYKSRTRQLYNKKKLLEELVAERTLELNKKNELLSQRQAEIISQKEELLIQRDHVNQQFETIQSLSEIGQKITSSLKKNELILRLYTILNKLMDVSHFSIGHLDTHKRIIEFSAISGDQLQIEEKIVTLDEDRFSVLCVEQKKVIRINDLKKEYTEHFAESFNRYVEGYSSAMYLPLFLTQGSIIGILVVKSFKLNAYSDVHLNTLKNLAAYIGIALENAHIYKTLEAQSELLTKQSEQLEQLDKMKTRFFINISHEFRTPLTLILTPLEQMLSDEGSSKEWLVMHRQLSVMHKNATALLHLINELLEIRNLESTETRKLTFLELDLVGFTESVQNCFNELAASLNIALSISSGQKNISAWFDPDMIQKVLTNIYSNALKFTGQGGHIETFISLGSGQSADHAIIQIKDNGMGIAETELPFVFERFYQGDAPVNPIQRGSGIGLSLIKELLQLHGGRIQVESKKGHGTTFTISLPLGQSAKHTQPLDVASTFEKKEELNNIIIDLPAVENKSVVKRENELPLVLIVEDNADVRELLRVELESQFRIVDAVNGEDGIAACLQYIPDLVLSDVMMPRTDGIELCQFLKTDERTSHIPLILLTAKTGEHSHIQGLNIGADDYIAKPFNIKILKARIHNLLASRKKLHALFSSQEKVSIEEVVENVQDRKFMEKVDAQILKHLKNAELNHEILAREIGMSKTQLYRKLQAITGKSVHEYIRNFRLRAAHELLIQNPATLVAEVAYEVGYKDPSYFSKCFFAFYHFWPTNLKKVNHSP